MEPNVPEEQLSLRERNKLQSRRLLEEALAGTATASGTATPSQQQTASNMIGGTPTVSPFPSLSGIVSGPRSGQPQINANLMEAVASRHPNLPTNSPERDRGGINANEVSFSQDSSSSDVLSMPSIARVAAENTGWKGEDLVKAVAIAMAESRGNPRGMGDVDLSTPGEKSVGLWQINYRPGRDEGSRVRNPELNINPAMNARNAYQIYQDQGWGAWSVTHGTPDTNNNHYSKYMDQARAAVGGLG